MTDIDKSFENQKGFRVRYLADAVTETVNLPAIASLGDEQKFAVRTELRRIERSAAFQKRVVLRNILRHIVERTLLGEHLTDWAIGQTIYADPDFVSEGKSTIRNHVRKIREQLAEYYKSEGSFDSVEISIPPRCHNAAFHFKPDRVSGFQPSFVSAVSDVPAGLYPTVIEAALLDGCKKDLQVTETESLRRTEPREPTWTSLLSRSFGEEPSDDGWRFANYLLLPLVFEGWIGYRYGIPHEYFVTSFEAGTDQSIIRIYRQSTWESVKKDLVPDVLERALLNGKWVKAPCGSEIKRLASGREKDAYLPLRVEHIVPCAGDQSSLRNTYNEEVIKATLSTCRTVEYYVWFRQDHIVGCPVALYHTVAPEA